MGEEGVGGGSTAAGDAVGNGSQASASQRLRPEKDPDLSEMLTAVDPTAGMGMTSRGSEVAFGDADDDDDERHQAVSSNDISAIKQEMNRLLTAPSSVLPPKRTTRQPSIHSTHPPTHPPSAQGGQGGETPVPPNIRRSVSLSIQPSTVVAHGPADIDSHRPSSFTLGDGDGNAHGDGHGRAVQVDPRLTPG